MTVSVGMASFRVGDAVVTRIEELRWDNADPHRLYPDLDAAALRDHARDLTPGSFNATTGRLAQGTCSWLLRLDGRVVLIDTATGNGKHLPDAPALNELDTPYLARLAAAGVTPEQVDLVVMTHVHADHVGWNTRWRDGRWVPTFTNARHVYSGMEARYSAKAAGIDPAPGLPPGDLGPADHMAAASVYGESMAPMIAAGLGDPIEIDGREIVPGLSVHSTRGHSIDHASVRLQSGGQEAWFAADVMHHPLQVYRPDLRSVYCEFIGPAREARERMLEELAGSGALCFTSHFGESGAGHVVRRGTGYAWRFAAPETVR